MDIMTITPSQAIAQLEFNDWNTRKDVVILHVATTNLHFCEVCRVTVIDPNGETVFDSLVKPSEESPISEGATEIHGITNEMVADSPRWPDVWDQLFLILKGKTILTYNASYDKQILADSFDPYEEEIDYPERMAEVRKLKMRCVMDAYARLVGSSYWVKIDEACGKEIKRTPLEKCRATLEIIRNNFKPEFTEEDLQKIRWWHELREVSRQIQYISQEIVEMTKRQNMLIKRQEELLENPFQFVEKEAAASADPFAGDIEDEDLPF
jgi:DNA polymerase-3 subunit epsilon